MVRFLPSHAVVLLAALLGGVGVALPAQVVPVAETRIITGTVRDSLSGSGLDAYVVVLGAQQSTSADRAGRFRLPSAPTSSVALVFRYIGYPPSRVNVPAGADSVVLSIALYSPPLRQPIPAGRFAALAIEDLRSIWVQVLCGLAGRADVEFGHTQMLAESDSSRRRVAPPSESRVVLQLEGAPFEWRETRWLRQLREEGLIAGVCYAPGLACPDSGFHLYLLPAYPERFADDSVSVHIDYTAIDREGCKRAGGMGDETSENWLVVRSDGVWMLKGLDYAVPRTHRTLVCGPL